ncbi:2-hydroxyacid dehydrogenase [Acinetobacter sp. MD2(2019)]|uniref:2-hydroxyacid dehydrogenase n=1 Tax=Acinetobacter sp. MD2(2019) TaxID=2605273 RepID=UPI002D1E59C1|nr:2-hydroxyacid dehydrogenase [Acinetobacter sp. MD2(2019)]MEB3753348.1 2-hydroxyacid dehydrogenase [Acinetobacter sp. MD2(2019)]
MQKLAQEILMLGPQIDVYVEELERQFSKVHKFWQIEDKATFLKEHADKIQGLATSGGLGVKKELLEQLPQLEIIASSGVGYDSIDVAYAHSRNIIVTNTPNVLNDCVADTGMMLIYAVARQLVNADQYVRSGAWGKGAYPLTTSLKHKVCGIAGLGNIGLEVAARAQACGMKIAYTSRSDKKIEGYQYVENVEALAEQSDFLVLTLPSTPDTHHLINANVLSKLGEKGFLINIARGSVVDEKALIAALKNNDIAGAGLDVFEKEPCTESELFALKNVVLTPHYASGTRETRKAMGDLACANLYEYFTQHKAITPVV